MHPNRLRAMLFPSTRQSGLRFYLLFVGALVAPSAVQAQNDIIGFDSDRWNLVDAEVAERLNRTCLSGAALLKDVEFENGVIEVDIAVDGSRSYPGLIFRVQDDGNYERFYVRPHRAGLYPDALQYTPVFNGVAGWQLYNGDGFTAGADVPTDEWVHLRMEVMGSQARVYLGDAGDPALEIDDLKHGISSGGIGVLGPKNSTACFSNFSYRADDSLQFDPAPAIVMAAGTVTDWEVSRSFKAQLFDRDVYPRFFAIFAGEWQPVTPEATGLVDVARYAMRNGPEPDLVFAKTVVRSDKRQKVKLTFGYSDEIDLFFNREKVFSGKSGYRHRDPSFLGIVGPFDSVDLTLEKGLNEIFMMVTETFGGWGFMAGADRELNPPIVDTSSTTRVWETPQVLLTPESVVYDPEREVLYVSNFDVRFATSEEYTGYISRVGLDGTIVEQEWVVDLNAPTGMGIRGGVLYVLERDHLTEIDIDKGQIVKRYPVPGSDFLNDLVIDDRGDIYMTDTRPSSHVDSRIYRFSDGRIELWLDSDEIIQANGIWIDGDRLIVGNTGDAMLKAVALEDKRVSNIVCLGSGVLDGIRIDNHGNYLVSHWEGQVYAVTRSGAVVKVLDTAGEGLNTADFEYIREKNLLVIPTFLGNNVVAYRVTEVP